MRTFLTTCLLLAMLAPCATAQDDGDQAYWYVSYYTVDWPKVDSLTKLWKMTEPVRAQAKADGEMLAWIGLVHHTGNEHNVVSMTKYPSWSAMNASSEAMRKVFTNANERARINEGYGYVFAGAPHQDVIYSESPGSIVPSLDEEGFWYASFYDMPWPQVDSLRTLWQETADVPAEAIKNGSIVGNLGLVHHTGGGASVVVLTKFPTWDALEARSWNGAFRTVVPDEARRNALNAGFRFAYREVPHYDVIYGQPVR